MKTSIWLKSDGEEISDGRKIIKMDDMVLPDNWWLSDLIDYGTAWWELLPKKCKHHKGRTRTFPYNEVSIVRLLCCAG